MLATDLTPAEIQQSVDVHSPTASGGRDPHLGFSPDDLVDALPGYRVIHIQTSAHLGKFDTGDRRFFRLLNDALCVLFPRHGDSFSIGLKKTA